MLAFILLILIFLVTSPDAQADVFSALPAPSLAFHR
jgi:hypothetical protein